MVRFFAGLPDRGAEVRSRCRRTLQALAQAIILPAPESHPATLHVDSIGASV